MILLDTNVLSELMRPAPDPAVERWLVARPDASLFISAITEAELRYGTALLPGGKRRSALTAEINGMSEEEFDGRILPFDRLAAQADVQIAAIACSRGATLATRNVADFEGCGVEVINPWSTA